MLKAGIVTFHEADNFGAVLQCYALQKYLVFRGFEVKIAGDEIPAIKNFYKVFKKGTNIKERIIYLMQAPSNLSRKRKFDLFRKKHLNISKSYNDCDLYVCGSDQIWNFDITGGFEPKYFADFPKKNQCVTISYAASIGTDTIKEERKSIFNRELQNFYAISVREDRAKAVIGELCDKDITVVPDPTLLLGKSTWSELATSPTVHYPYVLIYSLNNCEKTYDIAEQIADELGIECVEIRGFAKPYKYKTKNKVLDNIGPIEFLSYIKNAAFVVTDSFHGTVFSIVFQKQFYSIPPHGLGSRMETLLFNTNLSSRLVDETCLVSSEIKTDFSDIEEKLKALRSTASQLFDKVEGYIGGRNEL